QTDQRRTFLGPLQSGKPHLPIEPWLVRRAPARCAFHVTGFPFEFVGQPFNTFCAAFEHDFAAVLCHHPEQPIAIHDPERFELFVNICQRKRWSRPWFERTKNEPRIDGQRDNDHDNRRVAAQSTSWSATAGRAVTNSLL